MNYTKKTSRVTQCWVVRIAGTLVFF